MRRILRAWVLCGLLIISCSFTSRAAAGVLLLQFDKLQLKPGETAEGTVQVAEDGVTNGMVTITYDTRLELLEAKKADGQEDLYVSINSHERGKLVIAFAGKTNAKKGALIDLTFQVSDQAEVNDKYPVDFTEAEVYDAEGKALPVDQEGQILVVAGEKGGKEEEQKPQPTPGQQGDASGTKGNTQDKTKDAGNSKKKKSVSTGDSQELMRYAMLCGLAVAGIGATIAGKRREDGKRGEK